MVYSCSRGSKRIFARLLCICFTAAMHLDWDKTSFYDKLLYFLCRFQKYNTCICLIRPVAGQGSSPETRFSFLKHFRFLYPFTPNTIQINQRLCNNWHCKDFLFYNLFIIQLIYIQIWSFKYMNICVDWYICTNIVHRTYISLYFKLNARI